MRVSHSKMLKSNELSDPDDVRTGVSELCKNPEILKNTVNAWTDGWMTDGWIHVCALF